MIYSPTAYAGLAVVGFVAGALGGMMGVGGSVLMIPAMTLGLGVGQHVAQAAAMIVNFFVVAPSVRQHLRARAVLAPVVRVTVPVAAIGVILGVFASESGWFRGDREVRLAQVFGGFLFYVAAYNAYRLFVNRPRPAMDATQARALPRWRTAMAVGLPTGFVGGLLGVGGGALAVPLQQVFLRLPLRNAIANSAVTIIAVSVIGASIKNGKMVADGMSITESGSLALVLIPTAVIGGYLGGRLTHRTPIKTLRVVFIALMLAGGWKLIGKRPPAPDHAEARQAPTRNDCALSSEPRPDPA